MFFWMLFLSSTVQIERRGTFLNRESAALNATMSGFAFSRRLSSFSKQHVRKSSLKIKEVHSYLIPSMKNFADKRESLRTFSMIYITVFLYFLLSLTLFSLILAMIPSTPSNFTPIYVNKASSSEGTNILSRTLQIT